MAGLWRLQAIPIITYIGYTAVVTRYVFSAALGVAVGLAVARGYAGLAGTLGSSAHVPQRAPDPGKGADGLSSPRVDSGDDTSNRLATLEQRLAQLERERASAASAEATAALPHSQPSYEQEMDDWNQRLAAHDNDARDPQWAADAARKFDADFSSLSSELGFAFDEPVCRSHSCTVEVEWPSHGEALDEYTPLIHHDYAVNCARSIVLPRTLTPNDPAHPRPYRARVLFEHCNVEAGEARPLHDLSPG